MSMTTKPIPVTDGEIDATLAQINQKIVAARLKQDELRHEAAAIRMRNVDTVPGTEDMLALNALTARIRDFGRIASGLEESYNVTARRLTGNRAMALALRRAGAA